MDIQAGLYGVKKENNKNLEILKNLDLFEKAKLTQEVYLVG